MRDKQEDRYTKGVRGLQGFKFFKTSLRKQSFIAPNRRCYDCLSYDCLRRPMNTSRKFHIYPETRGNNQINNKITVSGNVLFDALIYKDIFSDVNPNQHVLMQCFISPVCICQSHVQHRHKRK